MSNNRLTLFHGSDHIIEKPRFGAGKKYNDYGQGFYCTCDRELSKEWACPTMTQGISNQYSLDTDGLMILNICEKPYSILHWLTMLLENRVFEANSDVGYSAREYLLENYHVDTSEYDVIIGYRADDSYFTFARDFINGGSTISTLSKAMRLGGLGEQVFIKSQRAFERLTFIGYEVAVPEIYCRRRKKRDIEAREAYGQLRKEHKVTSEDILAFHITTGLVKKDDPRLLF